MATAFERVRKIIVDQLGVEEDQVVPSASFVDDLNADSLDLVELIMSMEEEFSKDGKTLEISDEDAEKIATVQDAVDYLKDLGVEDEGYLLSDDPIADLTRDRHMAVFLRFRCADSHPSPTTVAWQCRLSRRR